MTAQLVDDAVTWQPNGRNVVFHPLFGGRWAPEPCQAHGVSTRCPDPDGGARRGWWACTPYPTMGFAAAAWIAAKCGLTLDPWQVEVLRRAWLYDPVTLDWVVEDVLIVGPEGIGKSAFFAAIGLWLLEGPCMPPVETPTAHARPFIPIVSAALSLTKHIHKHASHYIERDGSPLAGRLTAENTRIFRADQEDHQLHFPAASGAYQQGGEPVPAIIEEELHVLNSPGVKATGEETIKVVSSKRIKNANPKVQRFTITNPDDGDPDSLLGKRWRYASRVLDGELVDPSLLAIHFHCALPVDLDDPDDLRRAVREATPASWVDPEGIVRKFLKGEFGVGWTMRFSLGLFYAGDDQVLPDGALEARAVPPEQREPPPPDVPVALAFDGARNRDSIGLVGCTPDGYGFVIRRWERPPDAEPGWRYPKIEIHKAVVRAMEVDHPKAMLGVDDTFFEDYASVGFEGELEGGRTIRFEPWERRWPDRVVLGVQQYGSAAWTQLRQAVIDGGFTWDGDPAVLRHMRNAVEQIRTVNGRTFSILRKKRDDGAHPIDLFVAMTYAYRLAQHLEEPDEDLDDWRDALGLTKPGD